jgi:hypothetical protein
MRCTYSALSTVACWHMVAWVFTTYTLCKHSALLPSIKHCGRLHSSHTSCYHHWLVTVSKLAHTATLLQLVGWTIAGGPVWFSVLEFWSRQWLHARQCLLWQSYTSVLSQNLSRTTRWMYVFNHLCLLHYCVISTLTQRYYAHRRLQQSALLQHATSTWVSRCKSQCCAYLSYFYMCCFCTATNTQLHRLSVSRTLIAIAAHAMVTVPALTSKLITTGSLHLVTAPVTLVTQAHTVIQQQLYRNHSTCSSTGIIVLRKEARKRTHTNTLTPFLWV